MKSREAIFVLYIRLDLLQDQYDILPWWSWRKKRAIRRRVKQLQDSIKNIEALGEVEILCG